MKYYIWLDDEERPLSKAWRYEDETERMAEEATSTCCRCGSAGRHPGTTHRAVRLARGGFHRRLSGPRGITKLRGHSINLVQIGDVQPTKGGIVVFRL